MKNKNQIEYLCANCRKNHTTTLHEIIYGRGNKKLCIQYNIQVPLCMDCHTYVHRKLAKEDTMKKFIKILKLDYTKTTRAIQYKSQRLYIINRAERCLNIIKGYEI